MLWLTVCCCSSEDNGKMNLNSFSSSKKNEMIQLLLSVPVATHYALCTIFDIVTLFLGDKEHAQEPPWGPFIACELQCKVLHSPAVFELRTNTKSEF